jgi:hypothetical protein
MVPPPPWPTPPGPIDPDQVLDNFLYYVSTPDSVTNKPDLKQVMALFDTTPKVGITNYGPQYNDFGQVKMLWRQIFFAFTDFSFEEQQFNVRLSNPAAPPPMISTQVSITGQHTGAWFAKGTKWYSPPLSDIIPDSSRMMNLDACAVFTFTPAGTHIKQLSLYFDRYLMSQHLTLP